MRLNLKMTSHETNQSIRYCLGCFLIFIFIRAFQKWHQQGYVLTNQFVAGVLKEPLCCSIATFDVSLKVDSDNRIGNCIVNGPQSFCHLIKLCKMLRICLPLDFFRIPPLGQVDEGNHNSIDVVVRHAIGQDAT